MLQSGWKFDDGDAARAVLFVVLLLLSEPLVKCCLPNQRELITGCKVNWKYSCCLYVHQ